MIWYATPVTGSGRLMIRDDQPAAPDQPRPSDEDLVREAQRGSAEAFNRLYERYLPMVYNRVRYTIPGPDIEDVTQEIFIAVIRSLGSFRGTARFSTWLRTLVNRRVADYYRSRREQEVELPVDLGEDDPPMARDRIGAYPELSLEDSVALRQALAEIPESYREVLLLRFVEGLQFHEIASERGQSLEAAKSLFRRAVAALRGQLNQRHA